jgi:hypothetical protein
MSRFEEECKSGGSEFWYSQRKEASYLRSHRATQAKKNGRATANAAGRLMLVVGTAAGNVRAFSAATAKELWAANGCNEGCAESWPSSTPTSRTRHSLY